MSDDPQNDSFDEVKPAGAEALNKAKSAVMQLPLAEKFSLGGGVLYLLGAFILKYAKSKVTGTLAYGDLDDYGQGSITMADDGGFWFWLGLAAAIIAIALPFINLFMKNFKLPLPKPMTYLLAGVVGALAPIIKWILTDDKSVSFMGITVKAVPDLGFYAMVIAGALIAYGGFQSGGLTQLQKFFGQAKAKSAKASSSDDLE